MKHTEKQNSEDTKNISCFFQVALPIVVGVVKTFLRSSEFQIRKEGFGFDMAFSIKCGEKEIRFYLHNLFMEIATVDRDEEPIRFDGNLRDFDYFLAKMARVIESKLKILFRLLAEENPDIALEKITQMAKDYQRIRIIKLDQSKQA